MTTKHGFFSIDALLSIIPILLMLTVVFQIYGTTVHQVTRATNAQELFDKLVSAGEYTVRIGAIRNKQPNWIDEGEISSSYQYLASKANIANFYLSLDEPSKNYDSCIYRVVAVGDSKKITKLFICGDYANN